MLPAAPQREGSAEQREQCVRRGGHRGRCQQCGKRDGSPGGEPGVPAEGMHGPADAHGRDAERCLARAVPSSRQWPRGQKNETCPAR